MKYIIKFAIILRKKHILFYNSIFFNYDNFFGSSLTIFIGWRLRKKRHIYMYFAICYFIFVILSFKLLHIAVFEALLCLLPSFACRWDINRVNRVEYKMSYKTVLKHYHIIDLLPIPKIKPNRLLLLDSAENEANHASNQSHFCFQSKFVLHELG